MKLVIAIVTTVVLTLAVAPVFADDLAMMNEGKELGLDLYATSVEFREAAPERIAVIPAAEGIPELGIELYETHVAWDAERAQKLAEGIEAGGVGAEETVKSFDYLGSTGSDLP